MMKAVYESPLSGRYASEKMKRLFSPDARFETWRRLWVELARAEHELGLPVTAEQVAELEAHIRPINYEDAERREREVRHDVMAHVYAYGLAAPGAKGIIHLGATSCYVTDNADLILYRDGLRLIRASLLTAMDKLAAFAERYAATPCLGYTHYQPAQLVTLGKRASLWLQDLMLDLEEIDDAIRAIRFLGCRGTTGTEASFLALFDGDTAKIDEMNRKIAARFGFERIYDVCGQTYPRKLDSRILAALSSVAQSASKFATDVRLLQHDRQLEEPFEKDQIGSSAMAYKRNPMRCERICSLARYVIADALNAPMTAASQWMERTLDDSANRRISLPEAFLATDGILRLVCNVAGGLHVEEKIVEKSVRDYLPFIATENLLMAAVRKGGDRQAVHEIIRRASMEATEKMRRGESWDLVAELAAHEEFGLSAEEIRAQLKPENYIGRSEEQTLALVRRCRALIGGEAAAVEEIGL
ncbi:MAG: adenylosuccinate lyase [Oscillospiraceae bacterium]|nr:adenylosuccinate lyase [Oscillospiraceae bacterium]